MFDMQLLHNRGIANLSYVDHTYVLVTYDIIILILCDIMWLWLNLMDSMLFNDSFDDNNDDIAHGW